MKNSWLKIWEREYSLHRMFMVMESLRTDFARNFLGFTVDETLSLKMPSGNDAFFTAPKAWRPFLNFIDRTFKNRGGFSRFLRVYEKIKEAFLKTSQLSSRQVEGKDKKSLAAVFKNFNEIDYQFGLVGQWLGFYLSEAADQIMRSLIEIKTAKPGEQKRFLNAVFTPPKISQIRKERLNLLKVALERDWEKRKKMLDRHILRFQWIPCINVFQPPPWSRTFFQKELKKISQKSARRELREFKQNFETNLKVFKQIWRRSSTRERILTGHAHIMSFIKDDRDDIRRRAYFNSRPLYFAVARALAVTPAELLLLSPEEIQEHLLSNKPVPKSALKSRNKGYALIIESGHIRIKTGKQYQNLVKQVVTSDREDSLVRGLSAVPGKVTGKANLVLNAYSLAKMRKGDILITVATHPDYLPAMRIAKAIVTDEGGLTCHAAIVSRELEIPCVVGTKFATRVLKDGDLVEVDANKGIVRKL